MLQEKLLLLVIWKIDNEHKLSLVLLNIFFERAYHLAWSSGCDSVRRDVLIDDAAGSYDDVIAYGNSWKYYSPASNKAILADSDWLVNDSLRILTRKVPDDTGRCVVSDKRTVEGNRRVISYRYKIGF